jgi:hypothetical protein
MTYRIINEALTIHSWMLMGSTLPKIGTHQLTKPGITSRLPLFIALTAIFATLSTGRELHISTPVRRIPETL